MTGGSSLIAFEVQGGKAGAFAVENRRQRLKPFLSF